MMFRVEYPDSTKPSGRPRRRRMRRRERVNRIYK
jgi:hypothetical protein